MGTINAIIANATNSFDQKDMELIKQAVKDAEDFINQSFTFDYEVDVIFTAPSSLMKTIPEDGISARTYHSRLIEVVIDKRQNPLNANTVFETVCHEMSHSLRWEKVPEYSDNLFKGMILEGLAVALERKAMESRGEGWQFFLKEMLKTTDEEYEKMIAALKDTFDKQGYDYETIFYTGNDSLPRWAGYRLGYYYVLQYLEKSGRIIEQATLDSYDLFRP